MSNKQKPTVTHNEDPILTLSEAAKQIGRHRTTLARWINEGIVKAGKHPSGVPGIRQSQVDAILKNFPV
jgi:predicted site-specific integrase-resolvase